MQPSIRAAGHPLKGARLLTPPRRWPAWLAAAAVASTMVIAVGLWLAGLDGQSLQAEGGTATSLGRATGLVASDLLLVQVLLMARIPWLESWYGQDTLARWHRWAGFTSFWLMLAHLLFVTVGYADADAAALLVEAWRLTVDYPGMLLAVAGTALLLLVVVLSIRAARRRMRYESWHLLHLYAYLGIGLALPHQLWTGADLSSPGAHAYWWTLYGVALAALVIFRFGVPLWRSAYHALRVHAVVREAPGVVSVYLRGRHLDRLGARSGQFFLWRFLDGPGWTRAHPYSLSAAPRGDELRITVKNLGDGSSRVARLRRGTRVLFEGPLGATTVHRRRHHKVLLVAAGVGITMLRSMLDELPAAPGDITVLYRLRDARKAVFREELDAFATMRGVRVIYLEGPRGDGWLPAHLSRMHGRDALGWLVPDVVFHDVFVCGPSDWMDAVVESLVAAGVTASQIHREEFAW